MQNLNRYIEFLGLKKPVTITIKTRKGRDCDAFYFPDYSDRTGKLKGHKITIYTVDCGRDFETLLAHELIHAWQEEKNKAEFHGKYFQTMAKSMVESFGLKNIYIKGVDK